MEAKEYKYKFKPYLQKSRAKMCSTIIEYGTHEHLILRTEVDSFLIAFDNCMVELEKTQSQLSEANQKLKEMELLLIPKKN